jgi:hypothetical protein
MTYIRYDDKTKQFVATKKRPNNQNTKRVLKKIAGRLSKYIIDHPDTELTELQKKFVDGLKKNAKKYSLSKDKINIAHGIAISQIIGVMVNLLNDPKSFQLAAANDFADAILSSESPSDDKGRSTLRDFFRDVEAGGADPKELCERANAILKKLNCATRNLVPGHASANQSIGEAEDPPCVAKKGDPTVFKKMKTVRQVSLFFKELLGGNVEYGPKIRKTPAGKTAFMSSSIFAQKEKSFVVKPRDNHSSSEDSLTLDF